MSSNEKPPRTLTRRGSVLPSIAWATALSDTGSPWWYVSSVASAAAPQLVSHCWTMTLACRISSRERTGPRPSAEAAPATASKRKKKARLVRWAFSGTTLARSHSTLTDTDGFTVTVGLTVIVGLPTLVRLTETSAKPAAT